MQHYHASIPDASNGNGAAHLTNYALHNVTQRTRRMRDPRMQAIRHVSQLQSLWAGDVGNYKWGGRQPVRRRRGDVHGDMTSVVLHFNWPGECVSQCQLCSGLVYLQTPQQAVHALLHVVVHNPTVMFTVTGTPSSIRGLPYMPTGIDFFLSVYCLVSDLYGIS